MIEPNIKVNSDNNLNMDGVIYKVKLDIFQPTQMLTHESIKSKGLNRELSKI
jgi:hypothetical protein